MGKGEGILDGFNFLSYLQNFLSQGTFYKDHIRGNISLRLFPLVVLFEFFIYLNGSFCMAS